MPERLLKNSERLQSIFESTGLGIWDWNIVANKIIFNDQWPATLGYDTQELQALWTPLEQIVHPDDLSSVRAALIAHLKGKSPLFQTEYRVRDKSGAWVWILGSGKVSSRDDNGRALHMLGTHQNIERRKRVERELYNSQAYYRALVENFPNGAVLVYDHDLRHIVSGGQALESVEQFKDVSEGKTLSEALAPEHQQLLEPHYRATLEGKSPEFELSSEDKIYKTHFVPIINQAGVVLAGLIVLHDVTESKKVEQIRAEEQLRLTRLVEEKTAKLSTINLELSKALRLKDDFLANMSHELRTPLNAVIGISDILIEKIYGPLTDEQKNSVETIRQSGQHLLSLINDILDLSKINAGKSELILSAVDVIAVCNTVLQMITPLAKSKGIKLYTAFDDDVQIITADEQRLTQVVVNLLSNAIKFTPDQGSIGLDVEFDPRSQQLRLSVWDSGVGISDGDLEQLFEPFVQVGDTYTGDHSGTGLGLALVKRIVEMHGGTVAVKSEVGQGSRFTVSIPCGEPLSVCDVANVAPPHSATAADIEKVLIIEDSATDAEQLKHNLTQLGIASVMISGTLNNERDIIDYVRVFQPDLIFLDIIMPDQSGWTTLSQLRTDKRTENIPVIMCSVLHQRARAIELGATEYLVKPVSRPVLKQAIEKVRPKIVAEEGFAEAEEDSPLVLLVEDEETNIKVVSDYLVASGYRLVIARNGQEAIECAHRDLPDLILMDIQMPVMDGLEAIRHIRRSEVKEVRTVPIVAVTALAMRGDMTRCLEAGADDYLSKPVRLKELSARISKFFDVAIPTPF